MWPRLWRYRDTNFVTGRALDRFSAPPVLKMPNTPPSPPFFSPHSPRAQSASAQSAPLRILWLKSGPLHPLDTGGKIRTFNTLRELNRRHRVQFMALWQEGLDLGLRNKAAAYSTAQHWTPWRETPKRFPQLHADLLRNLICTRLPYVLDKYRSAAMRAAIEEAAQPDRCDLLICDFLTPSVNLPPRGTLRVPSILFQHNVESLIWKRTAQNARGLASRLYFRDQWRRIRDYEARACAQFDGVVTVSEDDARIHREEFSLKNVLGAVPTGVDTDHFQAVAGHRAPRSLVFLGSMDWMPNIDAVQWFADAILPLIEREFPDATLTIVGRNPTPPVRALAERHPRIRVTGTVDDVRPFLAGAEAMIVPLRVGGGTRIKIFEAMATGIPVVSTRIGAEGLPLCHDRDILLADTPEEFAQCVGRLFGSAELGCRIGHAGLSLVREKFGWAASTDIFESYCKQVISNFQ